MYLIVLTINSSMIFKSRSYFSPLKNFIITAAAKDNQKLSEAVALITDMMNNTHGLSLGIGQYGISASKMDQPVWPLRLLW